MKAVLFFIVFSIPIFANPFLPKDIKQNKAGIKFYREGKFEEAAKSFSSIGKKTNIGIGRFNEGSALYKKGDFDEAEMSYLNSLKSGDEKLKPETLFNLGNTKFEKQDIEGALKSYQSALDLCTNPKLSEELRNNMQFVFNTKRDKKEKKKDQRREREDKKEKEEKESKYKQDKETEHKQPMNISPRQAKQLMNIINARDSKLQKKLLKKKESAGVSPAGKDW